MKKIPCRMTGLVFALWAGFAQAALAQAPSVNIRVITSGGFAIPLRAIAPMFEKASGVSVTVTLGKSQGSGPDTIAAQLGRGVPADVVVMSREGLDELIAAKRIIPNSDVDLAKTPIGLSVRAGAAKPDISTVAAFKAALLRAKSITFPRSTTGIYIEDKLFPELGIDKAVAAKTSDTGVAAVAGGKAEIAIQPVSELLHIPGTDYVGAIPAKVQYISVFSAAEVAGTQQSDAAKKMIAYLASAKAVDTLRYSGMEPVAKH